MISAQDFLTAFHQQWKTGYRSDKLRNAYQSEKEWTAYMMGKPRKKGDFPGTFLHRLAENLNQQACRERQNLDVVYYATLAQHAPQDEDMPRPACLSVIIEHEHKTDIGKEMWKMLLWRAPLKVLIFYEWPPGSKTTQGRGESWLTNKIDTLLNLRREINESWPEAPRTSYLFLVGRSPERGRLPFWEYCDAPDTELRGLYTAV